MSQGIATIWERVLERDRVLKKALSDASVVGSDPETDDPNDDPDPETNNIFDNIDDDEPDPETNNIFDGLDDDKPDPETNNIFDGLNDDDPDPYEAEDVVYEFEESADLWLSRSHRTLEDVILSMGLPRDVLPTNRPLLIFGSDRSKPTAPAYYRVEITQEGWPRRLSATEPLTGTDAAKILAPSHPVSSSFHFVEGETVAAEVPNSLLARKRWIVLWPKLEALPESKSRQWKRVRRVVWCVNREQIGPRDVIDWLSKFWQDVPIRIALFGARSFVQEKKGDVAQSKVLPNVHRSLEKFDAIKSHPWIVVGP